MKLPGHHSACRRRRQSTARLSVLLVLALTGCATHFDLDPTPTGSIAAADAIPPEPAKAQTQADAQADVAADDWEAVRRKVVAAPPSPSSSRAVGKVKPPARSEAKPMAWENAGSGNSGTITELIVSSSAGRACRNFATTRASVDGVRAYRGEVCRRGAVWEYTKLEPLDRAAENRPKT